jgi:hypothetical protein
MNAGMIALGSCLVFILAVQQELRTHCTFFSERILKRWKAARAGTFWA